MTQLEYLRQFQVTDRNLQRTQSELGIDDAELKNFPPSGNVLIIGSGLHRTFEKELALKRSDLSLISLDPTLGIITIDEQGDPDTQGFTIIEVGSSGASYRYDPNLTAAATPSIHQGMAAIEYDKTRKKLVTSIPGAVAGLSSALPFANSSFDIIIDNHGPIQYLTTESMRLSYFQEVKRVMKGTAMMYVDSLLPSDMPLLASENLLFIPRRTAWNAVAYRIVKLRD